MTKRHSLLGGMIRGVVAGTVATWAMNRLTTVWYDRQSSATRKLENRLRKGRAAYEIAAEKIGRLRHKRLTRAQRQRFGKAIHWTLGTFSAALYGALRQRLRKPGLSRGLAFGTAVWLLVDNIANYALRLTPGPRAFPWQTHARGLAGHLTYGAVADTAMRIMR